MRRTKSFRYYAYGLNIESSLKCPELLPNGAIPGGETSIDVRIQYGNVPATLEDPKAKGVLYQAKASQFLLRLDGIARYLVSDGKEIVIEPAPSSQEDKIRLFLLGSIFGGLLHQRGRLVLHGSSIEIPQGVVVFVGPSGVGKSTLAMAFYARGYRVLTDDVCAIGFDEHNSPQVFPGLCHIKSWSDAREKLAAAEDSPALPQGSRGRTPPSYGTCAMRRVQPQLGKYALCLRGRFDPTPAPLHAVYVLATTNTQEFSIEPLTQMQKFQALIDNTYRNSFLAALDVQAIHFQRTAAVARRVKVSRVIRPMAPFLLDELLEMLEEDFGNI